MEFDLSAPQQLLRDSARQLLAQECPLRRVRELMADGALDDAALWQAIAEQGWLGLHLPEAAGGLGASLVELAVVAEEMGRACSPGPVLASLWAATLLAHSGNEAAKSRWLAPLALGEQKATVALLEGDAGWEISEVKLPAQEVAGGFRLAGKKIAVLDAASADLIFCPARLGKELAIVAVDRGAKGLTLRATPGLDATRKLYEVNFGNVIVPIADVVAVGQPAEAALKTSLHVAALAACAEMVGAMQRVLEMTVEFAKTREQFGKPIGTFQAVQHHCANMLLLTESSRSATYFAAWALSAGTPDAPRALSQAKAYTSDAAREVCNLGVQVHGGIGFTWEHDLHLLLKRAKVNEALFGDATHHREQIARYVLDGTSSAWLGEFSVE